MQIGGKLVVLLLFLLGVAGALFAIWFNHQATYRTTSRFGSHTVGLIAHACDVELLELSDKDPQVMGDVHEMLNIDGKRLRVVGTRDVSEARGLIHARHALRQDASFDWHGSRRDCDPAWRYALRFHENDETSTLAFDFSCSRIYVLDRQIEVSLVAKIAHGLEDYFGEQLHRRAPPVP